MSQYKFGPSGSNSYIAPEFTFYAIFNREEYVISFTACVPDVVVTRFK